MQQITPNLWINNGKIEEAVDFYNTRFNINLSNAEKRDLLAFLRAL